MKTSSGFDISCMKHAKEVPKVGAYITSNGYSQRPADWRQSCQMRSPSLLEDYEVKTLVSIVSKFVVAQVNSVSCLGVENDVSGVSWGP